MKETMHEVAAGAMGGCLAAALVVLALVVLTVVAVV